MINTESLYKSKTVDTKSYKSANLVESSRKFVRTIHLTKCNVRIEAYFTHERAVHIAIAAIHWILTVFSVLTIEYDFVTRSKSLSYVFYLS